jgi:hypothetical protein
MTKKQLFFSCVISFVWVSVTASIYGQTENEFTVSITDAGDGVVITGYTGRQNSIKIPEIIQGMPVKEIGPESFRGYVAYIGSEHPTLTEIVLPEGITILRYNAFYQCSELRKVTLPASLKKIEWGAFSNCEKISSIEIPDNVTVIDKGVFSDCVNLVSIKMPKNLVKIAEGTFSRCRRLKSIVIPEGVNIIEEDAFSFCQFLESVTLPSTISEIQREAFQDCGNLVTVTIPDSVGSIKFCLDVFDGCKKMNIISQATIKKRGYKYSF